MVSHGVRRIRGLGWAAMLACAVAAAAGAGDVSFPTWRGDFSLAGVVNDRIPDSPSKIWEFKAGAPVPFTPVVGDGKVFFVTANGQIFALDVTGRMVWAKSIIPKPSTPPVPPDPVLFSAPPAYAFGTLVLASPQGGIYALDGSDGREKWSVSVGSKVQSTPNFVDMGKDGFFVVALCQMRGVVSAFDGADGTRKWVHDPRKQTRLTTGGPGIPERGEVPDVPGAPRPPLNELNGPGAAPGGAGAPSVGPDGAPEGRAGPSRFRVDGHIAVSSSRIAYGGCDSTIHVLSSVDGSSLAAVHLGAESEVAGGVAFVGKMVYSGSRRGAVCAVDTQESKLSWVHNAGPAQLFTTPAANERVVVFGSPNGTVTAIDPRDASKAKWTTHVGGMSVESPIIARERVVVTVDGAIRLLDLDDGKVLWTSSSLGDTITPPAVAGGMTIVGSDSGAVVAFGSKTGDMK